MKKRVLLSVAIIVAVIMIAVILLTQKNTSTTPADVAKCMGENSVVYVQLGCHACKTQEEMFGENYVLLNVVDCFYERDKCSAIEATPTWEIEGKYYKGVQTIEKLQELTGC